MPGLVLLMLESALPFFQVSSQAPTQHWQSGPQRSGWLEAVWPFASLNLLGPYLPLDTDSLNRGAAAAGPQLPSSLQCKFKFNLNLLRKFKFTGKLIPIISSFNVLSQSSKMKFKTFRGFKFKTLPRHVPWQQTRGPGRGTVTCQDQADPVVSECFLHFLDFGSGQTEEAIERNLTDSRLIVPLSPPRSNLPVSQFYNRFAFLLVEV